MTGMLKKLQRRAVAAPVETTRREIEIPLDKIRFDPTQPRQAFHAVDGRVDEKAQLTLEELAATIKTQGLIQAITVEELDDGTYIVRVGERRTRAHLLLGLPTIRSVVNNNLKTRMQRLIYQATENLARDDLTDAEIAGVIKELKEGSAEEAALSQDAIAAVFGKSAGWVTRFVAFGDDEMQRRWVQSGIADTAENVYRLKLLPQAMQLELLRRVDLPADDPEFLEKPLKRTVIDDFTRLAKMEKMRHREAAAAGVGPASGAPGANNSPIAGPASGGTPAGNAPELPTPGATGSVGAQEGSTTNENPSPADGMPDQADALGLALAAAAADGRAAATQPTGQAAPAGVLATGDGYELSEAVRQELVQGAQSAGPADGERVTSAPPVKCRVLVRNLEELLPLLRTQPELLKDVRNVRVEIMLPNSLASAVASLLAGVVVDEVELARTVQQELVKLG